MLARVEFAWQPYDGKEQQLSCLCKLELMKGGSHEANVDQSGGGLLHVVH